MESTLIQAVVSAQVVIMFSLGIGLEVADFKRVFLRPLTFLIAVSCQVLLVPLVAYAILKVFDFSPVFAAGLMILSFCPGGVTSNIITKLSRGDVALSVSLTAMVSVLSFVTIPLLAAWAVGHFMGRQAMSISIAELATITFAITTLPVATGVFIRHHWSRIADTIERKLEFIAIALWIIIVTGAVAKTFDKLMENFLQIGTALLVLPLALMLVSLVIARLLRLTISESKTLAIETSVQNSPMAITLAATISGGVSMGLTELALPAAVYSVTMYLVVLPFITIFRRWETASSPGLQALIPGLAERHHGQ